VFSPHLSNLSKKTDEQISFSFSFIFFFVLISAFFEEGHGKRGASLGTWHLRVFLFYLLVLSLSCIQKKNSRQVLEQKRKVQKTCHFSLLCAVIHLAPI